ncbi:MAG TPA: metal ABC transporter substrate-binding protein [Bacillota bacterium]|nr:metal ABC transporter substrate-binding protein [Bacillota bacterium]
MKKALTLILAAVLAVSLLAGCAADSTADNPAQNDSGGGKLKDDAASGKLKIVATLFPQYDFARQIAGDKAEVTLLLPPGMESHSYEPTPSDIIEINGSDLFIYTGKHMEAWAQKIIDSMKDNGSHSFVLDASQGIELVNGDPHIWTDPLAAKQMAANILDALCSADPSNAGYYKENAADYSKKLDDLDAKFKSIVSSGKRNEIIFGSRFALYYFVTRYGLEYESAFDSCSEETEPSAKAVVGLIQKVKSDKIPVVYYAEIEDPKVARSISAETGAKLLLFHSCHNVTKEEFENGATYLSLMEQNAENLKEGLN